MKEFEIHIPKDMLRTAQIIAGALPLGAIVFLAIVLVIQLPNGMPVTALDTLDFVLFIQAGPCLVLAFVLPKMIMVKTAQQQLVGANLEEQVANESRAEGGSKVYLKKLMGIYQTGMIIGCALLEGVVFFAIVVYLTSNSMWGLIFAGAFIPLMLLKIPTESGVQRAFSDLIERCQIERTFN